MFFFQGFVQEIYTSPADSCLVKIRVDYPPDPPWEPSWHLLLEQEYHWDLWVCIHCAIGLWYWWMWTCD